MDVGLALNTLQVPHEQPEWEAALIDRLEHVESLAEPGGLVMRRSTPRLDDLGYTACIAPRPQSSS